MSILSRFQERFEAPYGYRTVLRMGLPLVVSMASSTIMQFTDRLFLSKYSVDAIASALPAGMASFTLQLGLMGICGYVSVLIAQYVGSEAPHRVGAALWQGVWCALLGALCLLPTLFFSQEFFAAVGHPERLQAGEAAYFNILTGGAVFLLLSVTLGSFYSGRGQNRLVMMANMAAMLVNVPLDYLLIFGFAGIPPMGITGAAYATVAGSVVSAGILAFCLFTKKNDEEFRVLRDFRFDVSMFGRLMRFGIPSGVNLFIEIFGFTWFIFELGRFGVIPLAAGNIAFSVNGVIFVPMLGLNMAVSTLAGQAMGRGAPKDAEAATMNTLHLALAYMLPLSLFTALCAGPLMDVFAPGGMTSEEFIPVRELGMTFLYFIALYSLVDAGNVVFLGALKGAGDTLGAMMVLGGSLVFLLIIPVKVLDSMGLASPYSYWWAFTAYVMLLAVAAAFRFYRRGWHRIRVVETARPVQE